MQNVLTEREFVYVRHGFIPDLAPHMRAATASSVEAVLGRKRTEVEAEPFRLLEDRDVDGFGCRSLREHQQDITMVRRIALGMRGNVRGVGLKGDSRRRCGCGQRDVGSDRVMSGITLRAILRHTYCIQWRYVVND